MAVTSSLARAHWLAVALLASCHSRPLDRPDGGAVSNGTTAGQSGANGGSPAYGGAATIGHGGANEAGAASQSSAGGAAGETNDATPCAPTARGVPEGWKPLALYGSRCVYVPSARADLPAGLTWKPCAVKAPSLSDCREIAIDWTTDGSNATGGSNEAFVGPDGHVVLQLRRMYEDHAKNQAAAMALVVEVDGQVRQALWDPYDDAARPPFWFLPGGIGDHTATWSLYEFGADPAERAGFGGSDQDLEPKLLFELQAGRGLPRPGKSYFADTGNPLTIRDWADKSLAAVEGSADSNVPRWAGDVLYWSREGAITSEVRVWTKAGGSVVLRGFGDDSSRAASELGTDGKDLVWLEGSGRDTGSPEAPYPTRAIYTAPFTTDPEQLKPRRLRSWLPEGMSNSYPPVVGCGRAAFVHTRPGNSADPSGVFRDILVVRLTDGISWRVESPAAFQFDAAWTTPLALTCNELFAGAGVNVRRVALDALGEGTPAD